MIPLGLGTVKEAVDASSWSTIALRAKIPTYEFVDGSETFHVF